MSRLRRFFQRETPLALEGPVAANYEEQTKRMSAEQFERLYRLAGHTIKRVEVIPPRLGSPSFGEIKVIIRGKPTLKVNW